MKDEKKRKAKVRRTESWMEREGRRKGGEEKIASMFQSAGKTMREFVLDVESLFLCREKFCHRLVCSSCSCC